MAACGSASARGAVRPSELELLSQCGARLDSATLGRLAVQCYADALRTEGGHRWADAMADFARLSQAGAKPRRLLAVFYEALRALERAQSAHVEAVCGRRSALECDQPLLDEFQLALKAVLFYEACPRTNTAVVTLVQAAFDAFLKCAEDDAAGGNDAAAGRPCTVCQCDVCECRSIVEEDFNRIKQSLTSLGLFDRLLGDAPVTVATSTMRRHVAARLADGDFARRRLQPLTDWAAALADRWLDGVCAPHAAGPSSSSPSSWPCHRAHLLHSFHTVYAQQAVGRLYDALEAYPRSEPALADLKLCMQKVAARRTLVDVLRADVKRRLLHSGVNTYDILSMYTRCVAGLRHVDASGVLMEAVCKPIRAYIRQRADSVRCIASFLTQKEQLDLWRQQQQRADCDERDTKVSTPDATVDGAADDAAMASPAADHAMAGAECDIDVNATALYAAADRSGAGAEQRHARHILAQWRHWQPDPVDAVSGGGGAGGRRHADMVSMLVGIYGTKELFVTEYRELLAERMLRCKADAIGQLVDDETMYLEMLKMRFGAGDMHQCEVMLKDVNDSERLREDWAIDCRQRCPPNIAIGAMHADRLRVKQMTHCGVRVLSAHFWPRLADASLCVPPPVRRVLDDFTEHFERAKPNRTLEWLPQTGVVTIKLSMHGQTVQLSVTPLQAAVLAKFLEKESWPCDSLAAALDVSAASVRRRCQPLFALGVLHERSAGGDWHLCGRLPSERVVAGIEADAVGGVAEANDDDAQEESEADALSALEQYWGYISGLLQNMNSLKAERVHSLLRMFTSPGKDVPSLKLVQTFLNRKVKADMLVFNAGAYSLPKKK